MSTNCLSNLFCYVCGLFTPKLKSKSITQTIKNRYDKYFYPIKLCNQDKKFSPHVICIDCADILAKWTSNNSRICRYFNFDWPMSWREQQSHTEDCYFCLSFKNGMIWKRRKRYTYATVQSVTGIEGNGSRKPVRNLEGILNVDIYNTFCLKIHFLPRNIYHIVIFKFSKR